jgi:glycosyltransferase involved in cell wall biosynthesis
VPAVGTRWFGIPAIIVDGETGLLVDHKDVDDLTRALQSLIDDRLNAKRLGNNARARAALVYSATVIANTYLNHYNRIIGLKKCT